MSLLGSTGSGLGSILTAADATAGGGTIQASLNAAVFGTPDLRLRALISSVVGSDCGTWFNEFFYSDIEGTSGDSTTGTFTDNTNGAGMDYWDVQANTGYNYNGYYHGGIGTHPVVPLLRWQPWAINWHGFVDVFAAHAEAILVGLFSGNQFTIGSDTNLSYAAIEINAGVSLLNWTIKMCNNGTVTTWDTGIAIGFGIMTDLILFNDGAGTLYFVVNGEIAWSKNVQDAAVPDVLNARIFRGARNPSGTIFRLHNDYVICAGIR